MLHTESLHPLHANLDLYGDEALVRAFADDQIHAVRAVQAAAPQLAHAVAAAVERLSQGGRLVSVGAGTSGRLGVLDGVELAPTFSWPRERTVGLIAGGRDAMFEAVEGAEDGAELGAADITAAQVSAQDVVLLIAASGSTPYVLGALQAARAAGALTVGIANNPGAALTQLAQIGITLDTGAEVISGSTRLKAGTAQKIALNALSSAIMVRLHKVYGNLMVDLKATNAKLVRRSVALTMHATGCNEAAAQQMLQSCGQQVKPAIVALRSRVDAASALRRLEGAHGSVRAALGALHELSNQARDSASDATPCPLSDPEAGP